MSDDLTALIDEALAEWDAGLVGLWRVRRAFALLREARAALAERDMWERIANDARREMHARELHHFEEEQKSAELQARIDRAITTHASVTNGWPSGVKCTCRACRILRGEDDG